MNKKSLFILKKRLILDGLKSGLSQRAACTYAGLSHQTYYNWLEKGQEAEQNKDFDDQYYKFLMAVEKARTQVQSDLIKKIRNDQSWQSAAWLLERYWPQEFGRRQPIQQVEVTDTNITVRVKTVSCKEDLQ